MTRFNNWYSVINVLLWICGGFFATAFVLHIFEFIYPEATGPDYVSLSVGLVSLALGCIALYMAVTSDKRMKALSNLEFQEKIAMMSDYLQNKSAIAGKLERICWDFKAVSEIRQYASEDLKESLIQKIEGCISSFCRNTKDISQNQEGILLEMIKIAKGYKVREKELENCIKSFNRRTSADKESNDLYKKIAESIRRHDAEGKKLREILDIVNSRKKT